MKRFEANDQKETSDDQDLERMTSTDDENEYDEIMDIFDSPRLQYLKLKKKFLQKYRYDEFHKDPRKKTDFLKEQAVALHELHLFYVEAFELVQQQYDENDLLDVLDDLEQLVTKNSELSLPKYPHEQLKKVVHKNCKEDKITRVSEIISELFSLECMSLRQFENQAFLELRFQNLNLAEHRKDDEEFNKAAALLRSLRWSAKDDLFEKMLRHKFLV